MTKGRTLNKTFDPHAFKGTADDYRRYRVPYPQNMLNKILSRAQIENGQRLLDLACGPGRLTFALAPFFKEVWAVDVEPEMIAMAQSQSSSYPHIIWQQGRAEDLSFEPGFFDLITVGEAFHRLDKEKIARKCADWLKVGGAFVTLGCEAIWKGREAWQNIVKTTLDKWVTPKHESQIKALPKSGETVLSDEQVLSSAAFVEVETFDYHCSHTWSLDDILGNLYSTSWSAKRILGDDCDQFESELRSALIEHDASGCYHQELNFGYTLARKN